MVHIVGIISTAANAISWLNKDYIFMEILKGINGNDYINGKNMHLIRLLSETLHCSIDIGKSAGECFGLFQSIEGVTFSTIV